MTKKKKTKTERNAYRCRSAVVLSKKKQNSFKNLSMNAYRISVAVLAIFSGVILNVRRAPE